MLKINENTLLIFNITITRMILALKKKKKKEPFVLKCRLLLIKVIAGKMKNSNITLV